MLYKSIDILTVESSKSSQKKGRNCVDGHTSKIGLWAGYAKAGSQSVGCNLSEGSNNPFIGVIYQIARTSDIYIVIYNSSKIIVMK